jgi:O-antigen/teichoic acid export membrane protein
VISFIQKILSWVFDTIDLQRRFDDYVARNSTFLFLLHCLSIILVFFSNYALVKIAGTNNYGSYVYLFNLFALLVSFCNLGLDTFLLKKIAIYNHVINYPQLKGVIQFVFFIITVSSFCVAGLFKITKGFSGGSNILTGFNSFSFSFLLLLMLSVTALLQVILQGTKK